MPQAFSHFTWEYSNQMILVCDIQGVDHYFTDPQIHSHDGKSFGMGNIGMEGINKFLETHKCNSICKKVRFFMKCFYAGRTLRAQHHRQTRVLTHVTCAAWVGKTRKDAGWHLESWYRLCGAI